MAFTESPFVVNITGGTASIPTTNVFPIAPPATGMWAVWADVLVTTAAVSGTVAITIGWNNGINTSTLFSSAFSLVTADEQPALLGNFYAINSQPITYATTVSNASGTPVYTIRLRFQFLG